MPDIILNTLFNNPNLPTVPVPGFYDNFDGAAGAFFRTTDGKLWTNLSGNAASWNKLGDGTGGLTALSTGVSYMVADALAADGTLEDEVGNIGAAGGGLVLRAVSDSVLMRLSYRTVSGTNRLVIVDINGQTTTTLGTSSVDKLSTSDVPIKVSVVGQTVNVYVNNVLVIGPVQTTMPASATRHGLYGASADLAMRHKSLRFTPAS